MAKSYDIAEIPNVQIENRHRFTSNPDGILSQQAVSRIDSICFSLKDRGIAQVAVVAIDDIKGDDVFEFAYELFSSWGVGGKNDSGLGVLLVEQKREIRFITGYATEGTLPDALCKRIQTNYMLPYFRSGDYSNGMVAGITAINDVLSGSDLFIEESAETDDILFITAFMLLIIFGSIALIVIVYRSAHKCPECKKIGLEQQGSQFLSRRFGVATYEDTFICKYCGSCIKRIRRTNTGSSSHRRGGGGGPIIGGGFGGGFGGGSIGGGWGGGSFGGGGAGSRW